MTRYKWAIRWLVANDDCYWVTDPNGCMSVTASFVSDMFDKDDKTLTADLIMELNRNKHLAVVETAWMPITQARMIEQMQEARAAHRAFHQLREQVLAICAGAKQRYYSDQNVQNVLDALTSHVNLFPTPTDRATYVNERHYQRHEKRNEEVRKSQEVARRMAGVPTVEEAMAILHGKNALRRADLPTNPSFYSDDAMPDFPVSKSDQERRAEEFLAGDPFATHAVKPSRSGIIFPHDDPDDPELEFETPEELAPIANLPAGAVDAIIDPLAQDENNSQEGIDNPADLPDDSNGNPKEWTMENQPMREDGPFAIETYLHYSYMQPTSHLIGCFVVYADNNQTSHCVLLVYHNDE